MTREVVAATCLIAAACVLLFEGFVWVRYGRWPGYSVMDAISLLGMPGVVRWAHKPLSWLWLHKTLVSLPLPAVLVAVALVLSWRPSARR